MKSPGKFAIAFALAAACGTAFPQQSPVFDDTPRPRGNAVEFLYPEQITLPAGKASAVELHFRVAQGLHINSHTPHDSFLIPTELTVPSASGVRLENATYPTGEDITLPADPSTRPSVYTGEFTIQTRLVAEHGEHLVQARLRYQACDNNACLPPKTITVAIDVIGK